ncbi:MAG: PqqD family protein [Novosphingobium sp.]|nr:PqqD family protein [Novosphingobium sp.]
MIDLTRIIEPADTTVATVVESEVILLNFAAAETHFYGLRGAGLQIWEKIEKRGHSGEQIVAHLLDTCRGDAETIRADVARMIGELARHELIAQR